MHMTEEEISSVDQAVAQAAESEQTQDVQTAETPVEQPSTRGDVEYNWKEARRKMDTLEQRNYELEAKLNQITANQKPHNEDDELSRLQDDDIITAKQARNLAMKLAKQVSEQAIREREAQTVDDRLMSKFPDYQQVVSKENIDLLQQQEPELARSLYALQNDPLSQGIAAYKMLKKLGLGDSTGMRKTAVSSLFF
jgi:mannosyltransferase OCH1-like enzyme